MRKLVYDIKESTHENLNQYKEQTQDANKLKDEIQYGSVLHLIMCLLKRQSDTRP